MFASLICVASPVFRSALSSSPQPYFNLTAGQGVVGGVQARVSVTDTPPDSWVAWLRSLDGHSHMKKKIPSQSRQHSVLGTVYTEPEVQLEEQKRD